MLVAAACIAAFVLTPSVAAQAVPVPDALPQPMPAQTPAPSPPIVSPPVPVPTPDRPQPPQPPQPPPAEPLSGRFALLLHDGTYLLGAFGEVKAMPFEAVFGNIEIPIASIRTVDFAVVVNGAKTHRVQFVNGDMLTGNVGHVEPMKFRTSYGTLTVPLEHVLRMTFNGPVATVARNPASGPAASAQATLPPVDTTLPVPFPNGEPPGPIRPPRAVPVPDEEVR